MFKRLQYRPRAIANSHLREDVGDVILNRSFGHMKRFGNLTIAVAARHQSEYFHFSRWRKVAQTMRYVTAYEK